MKKSNLFRNVIAISVSFGAMVLLGTNSSKAVLQSNGNDGATYNLSDWMINVRKMEELGGAMGLTETVDSNLTSSSGSNNIDVHMEKNTEYGALAILSASSYGNPNKINDGETTTGNATGVVMKLNKERVAASISYSYATNFANASERYKNSYDDFTYLKKSGDAITETIGWHSSSVSKWLYYVSGWSYEDKKTPSLLRAVDGSIFSYYGEGGRYGYASYSAAYCSRAVIVQGDGV